MSRLADRKTLLTLIVLSVLQLSSTVTAQEILSYQAVYTARASGLSARAERRLEELEVNQFLLTQAMEVRVLGARLGTVEESSRFRFDDGNIIPLSYDYRRSGISSSSENVQFNWDEKSATSSEENEEWVLPLAPGVLDKLSFQLAMRLQLANSAIQELELQMVDSDEIETHLYRVAGTEIVETELGRFDTLKVERIRPPGSKRQTTFWLARDWHLLLVRFEQLDSSGSDTELSLREATLAGQPVTPLP